MPRFTTSTSRMAAVLLASMLLACGGGDDAPAAFEEIALVRLQASWYTQWPIKQYVVRNATEWEAVWQEPVSTGNPRPALPPVDFMANAVLGVSNGWGWCDSFDFKHVYRRGADYTAVYGITRARPDTVCAAVMIPRVSFILVPQPVDSVSFERLDE